MFLPIIFWKSRKTLDSPFLVYWVSAGFVLIPCRRGLVWFNRTWETLQRLLVSILPGITSIGRNITTKLIHTSINGMPFRKRQRRKRMIVCDAPELMDVWTVQPAAIALLEWGFPEMMRLCNWFLLYAEESWINVRKMTLCTIGLCNRRGLFVPEKTKLHVRVFECSLFNDGLWKGGKSSEHWLQMEK